MCHRKRKGREEARGRRMEGGVRSEGGGDSLTLGN